MKTHPATFVLDAGSCRHTELGEFLRAHNENRVVFTEIACMEAYKGFALINLRRSIEIVAQFPNQVLVLKSNAELRSQRVNISEIPRMWIDFEATLGFSEFCKLTLNGGHPQITTSILEKCNRANAYFRRCEAEAKKMQHFIDAIKCNYTKVEMREIVGIFKSPPIPLNNVEIQAKLCALAKIFSDDRGARYLSEFQALSAEDQACQLGFRDGLSLYMVMLKWACLGGHDSLPVKKFTNDIIDSTYVAFSSYFDGLLTQDKGLGLIYYPVKACIRILSKLPSRSKLAYESKTKTC